MKAHEIALREGQQAKEFFAAGPHESGSTKTKKDFYGDEILANVILRMRDSMFHYEFQCAIAEGDIGRAINVMAVSNIPESFTINRT